MIVLSGGFDPVHGGHMNMIEAAKALDPDVHVLLNSDDWLLRKKGYVFLKWEVRYRILAAMGLTVEAVDDADGTVCKGLEILRRLNPKALIVFGNGGDRTGENVPELQTCADYGIATLFGLGGLKTQSSSELVSGSRTVDRSWGSYEILAKGDDWQVKLLRFDGHMQKQRHFRRDETWIGVAGTVSLSVGNFSAGLLPVTMPVVVSRGTWHQAVGKGVVLEIWHGECDEADIEREAA